MADWGPNKPPHTAPSSPWSRPAESTSLQNGGRDRHSRLPLRMHASRSSPPPLRAQTTKADPPPTALSLHFCQFGPRAQSNALRTQRVDPSPIWVWHEKGRRGGGERREEWGNARAPQKTPPQAWRGIPPRFGPKWHSPSGRWACARGIPPRNPLWCVRAPLSDVGASYLSLHLTSSCGSAGTPEGYPLGLLRPGPRGPADALALLRARPKAVSQS